jgi:eukaryotic-like serine/threonine-protein kinase
VKTGLRIGMKILISLLVMGGLGLLGAWVANTWVLPYHVGSNSSFGMPSMRGLSRDEVYTVCAGKELVIGELPAEFDAALPSGYLIRHLPRAGEQVKPGRRISVVFSAGPRQAVLPELTTRTERQARLSLEDLGLVPGDLIRCPGAGEPGTVLGSRPGAGSRVPVGSRVDLLISQGSHGGGFLVPDLSGRDLESVQTLLAGSGLAPPVVRFRNTTQVPVGRVIQQSPPSGSRLERGRTLELVVASGKG